MGVPRSPLRIALDVVPMLGRRTGIGHAVAALAGELAARDEIELVPFSVNAARPATVAAFDQTGLPRIRHIKVPGRIAQRIWTRTDAWRIDRHLGRGDARPDVVHGANYIVPPARAPRLVSVYDCWFLRHPDLAAPALRRVGVLLSRAVARGAVVHTSSQATADAVGELFPGCPVRVVHLGALALAEPTPACPIAELDGRPFVVSIATLERRKNLARLVEAFGLLAGSHPELHLVLAGGDGDARPEIDAAIDRLPAAFARRVLLTGYIDEHVRSWLLHRCEVLAYPSLDEGFGFPLLDAMQAGVPVVAARAGSIPEVAGDAAELVDPGDVDALAGALDAVLSSPNRRHRLVRAGAERVAQFTWQRCADGLVDVYRDMAA